MKKMLMSIILVILVPFILFFLEQFLFNMNLIIFPNVFLIYFVFIVSSTNYKIAYILAFISGIFVDYLFAPFIGVSVFAFLVVAVILNIVNSFLKNETKLNSIIKISIATIIFEILRYTSIVIFSDVKIEFLEMFKITFVEILFNVLIVIILHIPFEKQKGIFKSIYSKSNILTRYF